MHPLTTETVLHPQHVGIRPRAASRREAPEGETRSTAPARVAAIIVTWNRKQAVDHVLKALARQDYRLDHLDVVVVDNGSSDGTADLLIERWQPEVVADNPTQAAHEPDFRIVHRSGGEVSSRNIGGFASLTIVRNTRNHGGCGGFNTGLAFLEQFLDSTGAPLGYAWLLDDDVDVPPEALMQLTGTAERDPRIGVVGSRTIDFDDRDTTTETTIYFDYERGWMGPEPTPGHAMHDEHQGWVEQVGGTRGALPFTGVRDVDVVSACSLVARWSAVKEIGFWDSRYFIYCDDADWCLRFRSAGFRVVVDLDAVVYHTHWLAKLTPERGYYSQRNLIWVIQKTLAGMTLKKAMLRRLGSILRHSFKAMTHCALFHAEIIRRTAHDVVMGRGGQLDDTGPAPMPVLGALREAGALQGDATVLVMCTHHESIAWADELRSDVMHALLDEGRLEAQPRWVYMVRSDVPDAEGRCGSMAAGETAGGTAGGAPERIIFEPSRKSKWRTQRRFLRRPPSAVVVFDLSNDFPLLNSRFNIHIERRRPEMAQLERDGPMLRARFLARWFATTALCVLYGVAARRRIHAGKYG